MLDKLLKLKDSKKWLFYLLIIPFIVLSALDFYKRFLVNKANNDLKGTNDKDKELENKENNAKNEANDFLNKVKQNEENIKKINNEEDLNWHEKV